MHNKKNLLPVLFIFCSSPIIASMKTPSAQSKKISKQKNDRELFLKQQLKLIELAKFAVKAFEEMPPPTRDDDWKWKVIPHDLNEDGEWILKKQE